MDVGAGAYRIQMISRVFDHAFKTLLAYVSEPMEETDSILARILPPTEEMAKRRVLKDVMEGKRSGEEGVASEGVAAAAASVNGANGGVNNGKERGMKQRQKDKRNHSKNWDKNKDNKKRRHSSGGGGGGGGSSSGGSDHVGGKFKNKNKKKRYSK
jgi:uncharacterized membrane protein YgcG